MSAIWSVAVVESDQGKEIFVGREDGTVEKFAAKLLKANPPVATLTLASVHGAAVTGLSAASGDEVTSASMDGTLKTFNTAAEVEGKREQKSVDVGTPIRCLLVAGEQTFLGGQDGNIHVLGGEAPQVLSGHSDWISALSMGEANLFSASYDNTVRVWDVASSKTTFVLAGHTNAVKVVQSVGTFIYTASRDDTLRVWTLPEAGEGGEAAGGAGGDEGEGGEGKAADGEGAAAGTVVEVIPTVRATAVVELPSTPHSGVMGGNNLYIGFADHAVRVISTKDLSKQVHNFSTAANATFRKCKKHLDGNAAVSVKNLRLRSKKAIKAKKQELLDAAAAAIKAAAEAAREARKAAAAEAAADEEEGEAEPEPEAMEEEEQELALSEEQEKELADFIEQNKAELEKAIAEVHAARDEKVAALTPISHQSFVCEREKFDRVSFTRAYSSGTNQAVVALHVDGITAYSATGSAVTTVECRPGVTVL